MPCHHELVCACVAPELGCQSEPSGKLGKLWLRQAGTLAMGAAGCSREQAAGRGPGPSPRTLGPTSSSSSRWHKDVKIKFRRCVPAPRTRPRSGPARMPETGYRASPSPPSRTLASPSPCPLLASPSRSPAHAQHAARVARPLVGPAGSLAVPSVAALKAAAGGAANELVSPRGCHPTAHPRPRPTIAGGQRDARVSDAAASTVLSHRDIQE